MNIMSIKYYKLGNQYIIVSISYSKHVNFIFIKIENQTIINYCRLLCISVVKLLKNLSVKYLKLISSGFGFS